MPVTHHELADFCRFAEVRLADGGAESLRELLDEWNDRRAYEESVARIRESVAQYEAGEYLPVDEAIDEVRRKLGWIS